MPPCKGHKKSRKGCFVCKRRRVKCDEERPRCSNCRKRGTLEECVYPSVNDGVAWEDWDQAHSGLTSSVGQCVCGYSHTYPTLSALSDDFPGALPACFLLNFRPTTYLHQSPDIAQESTDENLLAILPEDHSRLSLIDLALLHHFTIHTSRHMTVSAHPDMHTIWSDVVPKIAQSHPYVMHAILAAAAADMRTEESMQVGEDHYRDALNGIKEELKEGGLERINEHNCHALFLAVNISALYTFSASRNQSGPNTGASNGSDSENNTYQKLDVSWTSLVRSIYGVLDKSWTWVINGPIGAIILPYPALAPRTMHTLSNRTEIMLSELLKLCGDGSIYGSLEELADVQTATAYFVAVWNLRKIWGVLENYVEIESPPETRTNSRNEVQDTQSQSGTSRWERTPSEKAAALYSTIFQFVLRTPAKFWDSLEKKKPRALIIYAYFIVCFEALNFGCDFVPQSAFNPTGGPAATWWILGRAERDLGCVEDELRALEIFEFWKDWIAGAWKVWHGLRKGWWFNDGNEQNMGHLSLIVPTLLPTNPGFELDSALMHNVQQGKPSTPFTPELEYSQNYILPHAGWTTNYALASFEDVLFQDLSRQGLHGNSVVFTTQLQNTDEVQGRPL